MTWFKEGKPIKAEGSVTISQDGDIFTLKIEKSSLLDAGDYNITATNAGGATFHVVKVTIEGQC